MLPKKVEEFDGTNQRANITSVFLEDYQTTPGNADSNYFWRPNVFEDEGNDLNTFQALSLPDMGVSPSDGVEIRLVDTSEKLELVLPQLTEGQLASFNAIVATGESSTVRLDAKTFKKLDLAQQTADWSSHSGTAFIDSEDNPQSIVLVADSVTDLRNEGLVSPFGLVDEIEGDPNESLVDQITGISIGVLVLMTWT